MAQYIKCSPDVHQAVKVRAAQTGREMQEIADDAIRAALAAPTPSGLLPTVEKLMHENQETGVNSKLLTEIRDKLDLLLQSLHGEADTARWKDFDRRMGELKAATKRLELASQKPGGAGKAVRA